MKSSVYLEAQSILTMDNTESKDLLDMDDFEMDELLTEFAEEEKKYTVVELSDSEDELDHLVEEFATTLSDAEDNEKKSNAQVILSSSDDEIDNLLDGFGEDDSVENELVQVNQDTNLMSSDNDIDDDTYVEDKKPILVIDSDTQNNTVYDSAVEILVSDENSPDKNCNPSNLTNSETNESQSLFSLNAKNSHSQRQEFQESSQNSASIASNAESSQNCFKESKCIQQSTVSLAETSQNKTHCREFQNCDKTSDLNDISTKNVSIPLNTSANKNINTWVKSFIKDNDLQKNPLPVSVTDVAVLCDKNILTPINSATHKLSIAQMIESTIENCLKTSSVASCINKTAEKESKTCNENFDTKMDRTRLEKNAFNMLPLINNVIVSNSCIQDRPVSSILNCDPVQQAICKSIVKDENNSTLEDTKISENNSFSVKSEDVINGEIDNLTDSVRKTNHISEEKIFSLSQVNVKPESYLSSEESNCSLSKSIVTQNKIYNGQPNIPKIAVEIKIHISEDVSSKICNGLNESKNSALLSSDKIESKNSETADVSIKLNGLTDKFIVPLRNTTDENFFKSNTNLNSSNNETISNTFELKELKSIELEGASNSILQNCLKRKIETSVAEISPKKIKQGIDNAVSIDKSHECDTTLGLSTIKEALPENAYLEVSERLLDYLVLQAYQNTINVNFHKEISDADKTLKDLNEKLENLNRDSDTVQSVMTEFSRAQKEAFENNTSRKIRRRTVGINVKIINPEVLSKMPENAVPDRRKEENEVSVIKQNKEASDLLENDKDEEIAIITENTANKKENEVAVIKENKEASSLLENILDSKKPNGASSLLKNIASTAEKLVPELCTVITISSDKNVPQVKQKAISHMPAPAKFPAPNVVMNGNHIIPYLNPGKGLPFSNSTTRFDPRFNNLFQRPEQLHPQNTQNDITKIRNNHGNQAISQPHMSKCPENVTSPLNHLLQSHPSNKYDPQKMSVALPFRTAASIISTRTLNAPTYAIPQNSITKTFPSVSKTIRNEIFQLPCPQPGTKTDSALNNVFTKSATGFQQNKTRYPGNLQCSNPLSQEAVVSVNSSPFHHPAATTCNRMLQPNLQISSVDQLSYSASDPLTAMSHLSSSMWRPPLSLPDSTISVNPCPSIATPPLFYPRTAPLMNCCTPNQFYPNTSVNHIVSSPHDSVQLHHMIARNTAVNPPAPSSSRFSSVFLPPPSVATKMTTPFHPPPPAAAPRFPTTTASLSTSTSSISQSVNAKKKIPPIPEEPLYNESLPRPILKVTKEDNDVILSWNVDLKTTTITLTSYQIYSCHVNNEIEILPVWKKVGDIAALQLPMACRLRQFEKNNCYHFIIRVVDNFQRLGPFSNPASVNI